MKSAPKGRLGVTCPSRAERWAAPFLPQRVHPNGGGKELVVAHRRFEIALAHRLLHRDGRLAGAEPRRHATVPEIVNAFGFIRPSHKGLVRG